MYRKAAILILGLGVVTCSGTPGEDRKFEALAHQYIEGYLELNPEEATALGDHRYDNRLYDFSPGGIAKELAFQQQYREDFGAIDPTQLSEANRIDYHIVRNAINQAMYGLETLREHEWNPLVYNPGNAIYSLLARDFAPLPERLRNVMGRLKSIPGVLEQAKINLHNPPKIHVETAILQNPGTISLIRDELNGFLEKAPELKAEFAPVQAQTIAALEAYGTWLQNDLLPVANGDFRIGDTKFRRKLRYAIDSDLAKEDILKGAEADLRESQKTMYDVAVPLYKTFFPEESYPAALFSKKQVIRAVLDRLADDHPTAENIVDRAEEALSECEVFVRTRRLITMPSEPLKIITMPEFQWGIAVAYCDPPGPLDKSAETFYAIAPTPRDWTPERVESFFREYNNFMLRNLTIHEAMPGHFLQLAHANKFTAPTLLRSIFMSGTFVEGWATYAEQMMVEKGFGGPEVRMQQLKMRLRLTINAIIDQKIHTAGMTEQEAMDLMLNEGFQEEAEAAGKWRRACLSSTQLSTYYVGNMEINDIRNAYMAQHGDTGDLQTMHDLMLSFGNPAPKYVKALMGL